MVQGEEPIVGKRYLVVTAIKKHKTPFIGYTGIAKKPSMSFFDKDVNTVLIFDNVEIQRKNLEDGNYAWRAGIEVILLEDQGYVR